MAKLITRVTGMVTSIPTFSNTTETNLAVVQGKSDASLFHNVGGWTFVKGIGVPDSKPVLGLRVAQSGSYLSLGLFVRTSSGMTKISDIKGKRVARPANPIQRLEIDFCVANAGYEWGKDVIEVPTADVGQATQLLVDGKVDVAIHSLGNSVVANADVSIPGGVRWLDLDSSPAAIKAAQDKVAPFTVSVRPKGWTVGLLADTHIANLVTYLTVDQNAREDVVYAVVKALSENYKELAPAHPMLAEWTPDLFVAPDGLTLPYNPGAIKYYKEAKLWTDAAQKANDALLKAFGATK